MSKPVPFPALDRPELTQSRVESNMAGGIVVHQREQGRSGPRNYRWYDLGLAGDGPMGDQWYRARGLTRCQEIIAAHRVLSLKIEV